MNVVSIHILEAVIDLFSSFYFSAYSYFQLIKVQLCIKMCNDVKIFEVHVCIIYKCMLMSVSIFCTNHVFSFLTAFSYWIMYKTEL